MQIRCAAFVALFACCAAMLSACGQSNLDTVSAADDPSPAFRSAPGWTASDGSVTHVRLMRGAVGTATPSPTPGITATPRSTPTVIEDTDCNWIWAYQELSDITIQVSTALDAAGIAYSNVSAQTLGENCLNLDGQAQYFAPMETDYEITIPVRSLTDRETLGNQAAAVLFLLNHSFPPDSMPGPIAGQIKLTFTARGDTLRLVIRQEDAEEALSSNLRGSALLTALGH